MTAGFFGGLIGSWGMDQLRRSLKGAKQEPAAVQVAEAISGGLPRRLTPREERIAVWAVHYGVATILGAIYGGLAEIAPRVVAGRGAAFGATIWLGADEIGLPALGIAPPPGQIRLSDQLRVLGSHLVYGLILEAVRRGFRGPPDRSEQDLSGQYMAEK